MEDFLHTLSLVILKPRLASIELLEVWYLDLLELPLLAVLGVVINEFILLSRLLAPEMQLSAISATTLLFLSSVVLQLPLVPLCVLLLGHLPCTLALPGYVRIIEGVVLRLLV